MAYSIPINSMICHPQNSNPFRSLLPATNISLIICANAGLKFGNNLPGLGFISRVSRQSGAWVLPNSLRKSHPFVRAIMRHPHSYEMQQALPGTGENTSLMYIGILKLVTLYLNGLGYALELEFHRPPRMIIVRNAKSSGVCPSEMSPRLSVGMEHISS